ncbi:U6 snRNA-associated Sm-like protein LSm7 [Saitozyma sp. JCM 24511]|uniref:Sm-like protein lsm7 n=1 Tax=Saitozyma podzolica TaxID=1890683 RepID=A0A427YEP5_9TREE|nr:Sm-like protein lsm7 [Saitozyma podzolica]GFZ44668.1 U6 snRNA-associated Sm-like protein LSm7 [Saitozyma sp. JCM 24511]
MSSRGGGRGGASRGRGGGPGGGGPGGPGEKKKRESILNLAQYVDKSVRVKFMGGREVTGTLKGYDQLLNLVMDDVVEEYENNAMPPRNLGLVVLRGPNVVLISPTDGSAEIENPFA